MLCPESFTTVLEALCKDIKASFSEELLYADDLTLVKESPEGLKGALEAWKGAIS